VEEHWEVGAVRDNVNHLITDSEFDNGSFVSVDLEIDDNKIATNVKELNDGWAQ